jgi:hypothetical protein
MGTGADYQLTAKTMNNPSAEDFGNFPNASAPFGTIPNDSEPFRTVRNFSERTENHTLTVREVARLFEQAGVPRTERSIINWCQLNRHGVARLDSFLDENEGRYYITPQSVSRAMEEERAKHPTATSQPTAEADLPHRAETPPRHEEETGGRVKELERKNRDLEIVTRAKDFYLERLEKERGQHVEQLIGMSRYVGELETQLLQLGGAPRGDRTLPQGAENSAQTTRGDDTAREAQTFPQGRVAS